MALNYRSINYRKGWLSTFGSLELFSVIGEYIGMYLGVSIVAVYDFAELAVGLGTVVYSSWALFGHSSVALKNFVEITYFWPVS
ncbi:hypothetical protein CDAR_53691 [Caerostris darwini]|uniref:Uncharacterized protein n=1 Tax=Caerostris darwini TaxID=1538125 RepID=A0AAV4VQI6_9ARAC|nr:hypothetical protein CDAR_53691 [Caerostris darwini]